MGSKATEVLVAKEVVGGGARGRRADEIGPASTLPDWSYLQMPALGDLGEFLRFAGQGAEFGRRDAAPGSRFVGRGYLQNDIFLPWFRSKNER
jgi:hypothetical protein